MSEMNGYRWFKFWPQDWVADPALRNCSLAAQGLWMRLLCLMHEATPRGFLLINGIPPTAKQLASQTGATMREVGVLLGELKVAGVYSKNEHGVVFSRRMVKDTAASDLGRQTGKRGGNPELIRKANGAHPPQGGDPPEGLTPPLTTPITAEITPPDKSGVKLEARSQEAEADQVRDKKVFPFKPLLDSSPAGARGEKPAGDALDELMSEAKISKPAAWQKPETVGANATSVHVRRATKALAMHNPYGSVRSPDEQVDAVAPPTRYPTKQLASEVVRALRRQAAMANP
jgi:hypothetical protein